MVLPCIPANPDIAGIGLRTSLYIQALLSFLPALLALKDMKIMPIELDFLETQMSTTLITAFAVLASTIVQAITGGLTNFHATIVLNLSWLSNFNGLIYALLYLYQRDASLEVKHGRLWWNHRGVWANEVKLALRNPVIIIGSAHLTLMSLIGINLWSHPFHFGNSPSCTLSASISVFGRKVPLGSPRFKAHTIAGYAITLFPVLNIFLLIAFFLIPLIVCHCRHIIRGSDSRANPTFATMFGLLELFVFAIILVVDTELSLSRNRALIQAGDAEWTFGQSLAIFLLLVPLRDLVELLVRRRPERLERKLLAAVDEGRADVVDCITKLGADIKTRDTALHCAARNGNLDIVTALVKMGANLNAQDRKGDSALQYATRQGHADVVCFLLRHGAIADLHSPTEGKIGGNWLAHHRSWHETPLYYAVASGNLQAVKAFVDAGADINQGDWNGEALIHDATRRRDQKAIIALVEAGATVSIKEERAGQTPLHFAVKHGFEEILRLLLRLGANVNETADGDDKYLDIRGCSPLHLAARYGRINMIIALLDHGADIRAKDSRGWTPLHWAAHDGRPDIIEYLLSHGADLNHDSRRHAHNGMDTSEIMLPLWIAVNRGHIASVEVLIKHSSIREPRFSFEAGRKSLKTYSVAIEMARGQGYEKVVTILVEHSKHLDWSEVV